MSFVYTNSNAQYIACQGPGVILAYSPLQKQLIKTWQPVGPFIYMSTPMAMNEGFLPYLKWNYNKA